MDSEELFTDLDGLVACVDKKNPLALVFNTTKVLKKKIPEGTHANAEQWVTQAFPNLDLENFYYQALDSPDFKVVSISKKSEVDNLLNELKEKGIVPSKIALGISEMSNTLPYLDFPILGSSFTVTKDGNEALSINNRSDIENSSIDMNGLRLSNASLLSFSSILGALNHAQGPSNLLDVNQPLENGFKNKRFFNLGIQIGLSSLLVILLLNFVLFSHYRSKSIITEGTMAPEQRASMIQGILRRVDAKKNKLQALLGSNHTRTTYYLDRIGESLPQSILLDLLAYQPLVRPVRPDKPIGTETDHIMVSGQTNNKEEFATWTAQLESMDWVEQVEIEHYEYTAPTLDSFTLKILCDATGQ